MATYWENSCSFGLRYVSWYKCLIVSLVFSHLGFWSGNLFLTAPFPDLCLLVPFLIRTLILTSQNSTPEYLTGELFSEVDRNVVCCDYDSTILGGSYYSVILFQRFHV